MLSCAVRQTDQESVAPITNSYTLREVGRERERQRERDDRQRQTERCSSPDKKMDKF